MRHVFYIFLALCLLATPTHADTPKRIVALGDSLTAGYGLESGQSLTTLLEESLKAEGQNVRIDNAGVSGDTSAGGLARLEWAIGGDPKPSLVIVALGANDMLRALSPKDTYKNLDAILTALKQKQIPALLVGMQGPTNMGAAFIRDFNAIYPDLAEKHGVPLYPFFLKDVALNPDLNIADGAHPNLKGTQIIARNLTPVVIKALSAP